MHDAFIKNFVFELKVRAKYSFLRLWLPNRGFCFFFFFSEHSHGTKRGKMQLKGFKNASVVHTFLMPQFWQASCRPYHYPDSSVLPYDSHSHMCAQRLPCSCRDVPSEQTEAESEPQSPFIQCPYITLRHTEVQRAEEIHTKHQ